MTTDLEREFDQQLRSIAHALVDDAPEVPEAVRAVHAAHDRRRPLLMVTASVAVIGAAGLFGVQVARRDPNPSAVGDRAADSAAGIGATTSLSATPTTLVESDDHAVRVVLPGDSLASIAEEICTTAEDLAEYNDWPDGVDHPLFPDDIIRIPPGACVSAAPTTWPSPGAEAPPTTATPGQEYVVQVGDFLAGIAEEFGVLLEELVAYNDWPDGANHPIIPGESIRIPPGADDQSGESLPVSLGLVGAGALRRRRK